MSSTRRDPRHVRSRSRRLLLPLTVELLGLILLDVDEVLAFLAVTRTQVLLTLDDVSAVAYVMADRHLLGTGARVRDRALGFFDAAGRRAGARGRLI